MKNVLFRYLFFVFATMLSMITISCIDDDELEENDSEETMEEIAEERSTALIMPGAASRLNQLLALSEQLDNSGKLDSLDFISGVSAGSIIAVAMNGIKDDSNNFDWDGLKDIILNLSNDQIFTNDEGNLPVDTSVLETFFSSLVENTFGYSSFSDMTSYNISMTAAETSTYSIQYASNTNLDNIGGTIVESLMATTAYPYIFPTVEVNGIEYVDGGFVETIPTSAVIAYESLTGEEFDDIYIVSKQYNDTLDLSTELDYLGLTDENKASYLNYFETNFDDLVLGTLLSEAGFAAELAILFRDYPEFASRCYVYIPDIEDAPYYPIFDFSSETQQSSYDSVHEWSLENEPITLYEYLLNYALDNDLEFDDLYDLNVISAYAPNNDLNFNKL